MAELAPLVVGTDPEPELFSLAAAAFRGDAAWTDVLEWINAYMQGASGAAMAPKPAPATRSERPRGGTR